MRSTILLQIFYTIQIVHYGIVDGDHADDDDDHEVVRGREIGTLKSNNITFECNITLWPVLLHEKNFNSTVNINKLLPKARNRLIDPVVLVGDRLRVYSKCSCCSQADMDRLKSFMLERFNQTGQVYLRYTSTNKYAVNILKTDFMPLDKDKHESHEETTEETDDCSEDSHCLEFYTKTKPLDMVYLDTATLGRSRINADLLWINDTKEVTGIPSTLDYINSNRIKQLNRIIIARGLIFDGNVNFDVDDRLGINETMTMQEKETADYITDTLIDLVIAKTEQSYKDSKDKWSMLMDVTVLLKPRLVYLGFDLSAIAVVCMGIMSVGCCTHRENLRVKNIRPVLLAIATIIQTVVIPIIGMILAHVFRLKSEVALGLFVTSCLPGGGLAHLLVYLAKGDRALSTLISLSVVIVNIVTATLWIIIVGYYRFNLLLKWYRLVIWLLFTAFIQIITTIVNIYHPNFARGLLTWLTRPLLLLAGIFLITLGVYINHYVFHHVSKMLLIALSLLIISSFTIGYVFGLVTGCKRVGAKTFSVEFSVYNGLLAIVILRSCLNSPEGDLAAMVALWASFFTPVPWVFHETISISEKYFYRYVYKIEIDDLPKDEDKEKDGVQSNISTKNNVEDLSLTMIPGYKNKKNQLEKMQDNEETLKILQQNYI